MPSNKFLVPSKLRVCHHNTSTNSCSGSASGAGDNYDDVSSLGGVEEEESTTINNITAMTAALRSKTAGVVLRGLSPEERILWETVQGLLKQQQQQHKPPVVEETALAAALAAPAAAAITTDKKSAETLDAKVDDELAALQKKLAQQEKDHSIALRATQRVLADVTQERDKTLAQLLALKAQQQQHEESTNTTTANTTSSAAVVVAASTTTTTAAKENEEEKKEDTADTSFSSYSKEQQPQDEITAQLQLELDAKKQEIVNLHETLAQSQAAKDALDTDLKQEKKEVAKLRRTMQSLRSATSSPKPSSNDPDGSGYDMADLKKQLEEKSSALENAKMIIASLENASSSFASDTRIKLKAKDAEIASLKLDLQHYKKKLDTLAMELRDAQSATAALDNFKNQVHEQSAELTMELNAALGDLRDASIILETTNDPSSIQDLAGLLATCNEALQKSIDVFGDDSEGTDDSDNESARNHHHNREQQQRAKKSEVAFQEELKRIKEQALHYRLEAERLEKQHDQDVKTLYTEIQMLRVKCDTNMDVLAKKERELACLRDSLKVEDEEVGYISDDASDNDDEHDDDDKNHNPPPPPPPPTYSPSHAEALATLLAHGKQQQDRSSPQHQQRTAMTADESLRGELAQARMEKDRAMKELKTEKESLANAKMIISSLEKANKSMMEDLRSRLHDSNTAIASLLEKSMASEKTTAKLKAELEALRMERAKYDNNSKLAYIMNEDNH